MPLARPQQSCTHASAKADRHCGLPPLGSLKDRTRAGAGVTSGPCQLLMSQSPGGHAAVPRAAWLTRPESPPLMPAPAILHRSTWGHPPRAEGGCELRRKPGLGVLTVTNPAAWRACHAGSDPIRVLTRSLTSHVASCYPAQGRGHPLGGGHRRLLPNPAPGVPGWVPFPAPLGRGSEGTVTGQLVARGHCSVFPVSAAAGAGGPRLSSGGLDSGLGTVVGKPVALQLEVTGQLDTGLRGCPGGDGVPGCLGETRDMTERPSSGPRELSRGPSPARRLQKGEAGKLPITTFLSFASVTWSEDTAVALGSPVGFTKPSCPWALHGLHQNVPTSHSRRLRTGVRAGGLAPCAGHPASKCWAHAAPGLPPERVDGLGALHRGWSGVCVTQDDARPSCTLWTLERHVWGLCQWPGVCISSLGSESAAWNEGLHGCSYVPADRKGFGLKGERSPFCTVGVGGQGEGPRWSGALLSASGGFFSVWPFAESGRRVPAHRPPLCFSFSFFICPGPPQPWPPASTGTRGSTVGTSANDAHWAFSRDSSAQR